MEPRKVTRGGRRRSQGGRQHRSPRRSRAPRLHRGLRAEHVHTGAPQEPGRSRRLLTRAEHRASRTRSPRPARAVRRARRSHTEHEQGAHDEEPPGEGNEARSSIAAQATRGRISTRLVRIAELARRHPERAFMSLHHAIDVEWLREAYRRTRKDGAVGVDGQSAEEYARDLEKNLESLLVRFRTGAYRAPPVRRVHIPKGDGRTRPMLWMEFHPPLRRWTDFCAGVHQCHGLALDSFDQGRAVDHCFRLYPRTPRLTVRMWHARENYRLIRLFSADSAHRRVAPPMHTDQATLPHVPSRHAADQGSGLAAARHVHGCRR